MKMSTQAPHAISSISSVYPDGPSVPNPLELDPPDHPPYACPIDLLGGLNLVAGHLFKQPQR